MKKDILQYENAQEMAILYPETFEAPSKEDLENLKVDDFVKVCIKIPKKSEASNINLPESERFWVKITKIENDTIEGKVSNTNLIFIDLHYQDLIKFKKENIYSIDDNN